MSQSAYPVLSAPSLNAALLTPRGTAISVGPAHEKIPQRGFAYQEQHKSELSKQRLSNIDDWRAGLSDLLQSTTGKDGNIFTCTSRYPWNGPT